MTSVVIKPLTAEAIEKFNGERFKQSVRGIEARQGDEIIGYAGVLHAEPLQAFSTMDDALRRYPKAIVKAAKALRSILDSYHVPIYALANPEEKNAPRFLEFVGFEFVEETEQGKLYRWQTQ